MAVIAFDLGGTKLAGAIFDRNGKALGRSLAPLAGRTGEAVGALILDQLLSLEKIARARKIKIEAIGVSVPGLVYQDGSVWAPNIPGWKRFPLRRRLQAGLRSVPGVKRTLVAVENDRACHILGESWVGAARGCKDAIVLAVGTGIAAGILANGEVINGMCGTAGSIGWLALDRPFQGKYKGVGCFEYHASGSGLDRAARELGKSEAGNAAELFRLAAQGNKAAEAVLGNAVECWGMAVANLISLFNPEKVIFGGGVFGPAIKLIPQIRREAARWAQPIAVKRTKICASKLGSDAGLYGAGRLALRVA